MRLLNLDRRKNSAASSLSLRRLSARAAGRATRSRQETDLGVGLPQDLPVFLYHGEVDTIVPFSHVDLYAEVIPQAHVRRLPGHDHQINNDLTQVADDIRRLCAGS